MAAIVPVDDVAALMDANWNASNVTEPDHLTINTASVTVRQDYGDGTAKIYYRPASPGVQETPKGNHTYGDREHRVHLTITTFTDRDRLWDIQEEVRRICHAQRHSMTNFQRILYEDFEEIEQEENDQVWVGNISIILQNKSVLLETT